MNDANMLDIRTIALSNAVFILNYYYRIFRSDHVNNKLKSL